MMNSYFLVNVVHNDFKDHDAIFKTFYEAAAQVTSPLAKAVVNGIGQTLSGGVQVISAVAHGMGREISAQS